MSLKSSNNASNKWIIASVCKCQSYILETFLLSVLMSCRIGSDLYTSDIHRLAIRQIPKPAKLLSGPLHIISAPFLLLGRRPCCK